MKNLTLALSIVVAAAGPLTAAELKIGTSADYAPWESVDTAGQIVGFDRDVGDEMCKHIQATCTWENQAFDGLLPGLQVGMVDLACEGMTMIVVTHEMGFARRVADRVVFMDAGRIVEQASPEAFFAEPRHDRTRTFLRQVAA